MKVTLSFDEEIDSQTQIKAAISADELALCLYEISRALGNAWQDCEQGSDVEKLVDEVQKLIYDSIGPLDQYTE
jgi:hypothetical protein